MSAVSTFDYESASISVNDPIDGPRTSAGPGPRPADVPLDGGGGAEAEDVVADLLVHEPDEVGVGGGVADRVVAADQQRAGADGHVVEQRLGDLLVAADQGGGVARGAGGLGQRGPQALVVQVLLPGVAEQPLRPLGPGGAAQSDVVGGPLLGALEDLVGPLPGRLLGVGGDRAEADREPADRTAGRLGGGLDLGNTLPDAVERLAPEGVDVGVPAAHPDGVPGRAAEVDRQAPAGRADGGQRALHLVELALVVEALSRPPLPLDHDEELL